MSTSLSLLTLVAVTYMFSGLLISEVVVAPSVEVQLVGVGYVLPSVNVIEGEALNLTCHLANVSSPGFHWTSQADNTLSVAGPNLYIPHMRRHLAGYFYCNEPNHGGANVYVHVLYPPIQPTITGSRKVKKGNSVNFTCTSDSWPAPTYTWSNTEEPGPGEVLGTGPNFVYSGEMADDYWAFCRAENTMLPTAGSPVSSTATSYLKVDVLKPAEIWGVPDEHVVAEGGTLDVTCYAIGQVYWTNSADESFQFYGARLLIQNVQKNFTGIYVCHTDLVLVPTYGEPENTQDEKPIYITVVDSPVSWRCYDFSELEQHLLNTKVVMETDGISAKQQLCENHPGFVFANKDSSLAPGCGQCYCCQPDEVFDPDCDCTTEPPMGTTTSSGHAGADASSGCESNTGVLVAAVVGWIVAVIAVVVFMFYFIRTRRGSQDAGVTELAAVPANSTTAAPTARWSQSAHNEKPDLPFRKKKRKSEHIYLDLDVTAPSTNDRAPGQLRTSYDNPAVASVPSVATGGGSAVSTATRVATDEPGLSPTPSSDGYERPYASLRHDDTATQNATPAYRSLESTDAPTPAHSQEPSHSPSSGVTTHAQDGDDN